MCTDGKAVIAVTTDDALFIGFFRKQTEPSQVLGEQLFQFGEAVGGGDNDGEESD